MDTIKKEYFIDIKSGDILEEEPQAGGHFRILATDEEYNDLNQIALRMYDDELKTYERSHVPFVDYDFAEKNPAYDRKLILLYEKIHELGDEKAREHIESMDILGRKELNEKEDF